MTHSIWLRLRLILSLFFFLHTYTTHIFDDKYSFFVHIIHNPPISLLWQSKFLSLSIKSHFAISEQSSYRIFFLSKKKKYISYKNILYIIYALIVIVSYIWTKFSFNAFRVGLDKLMIRVYYYVCLSLYTVTCVLMSKKEKKQCQNINICLWLMPPRIKVNLNQFVCVCTYLYVCVCTYVYVPK